MYKITEINDCVVIEHNGAKRTYPKYGVDSFLLDFALDRVRKLEITTKQYNKLLDEYNHILHVARDNNIKDLGFWNKENNYQADWRKVDSEEL